MVHRRPDGRRHEVSRPSEQTLAFTDESRLPDSNNDPSGEVHETRVHRGVGSRFVLLPQRPGSRSRHDPGRHGAVNLSEDL
ncbi:hypothetical protein CHELA40_10719 [Chelatococcus asaccharovorans]|nr:hypothetical protein CHELA40_10719 [Chelatococcus asaccharovorans]